jgi:hypothetical protein
MINIVSGVRYLQVITSGAYSLDWTVSFRSHHGDRVVRSSDAGNISTATTTTILGVGGSDPVIYYEAYEVHLKNRDATNNNTVTLITDAVAGGDMAHITPAVTLAPGEVLSYVNGVARVVDSEGRERTADISTKKVLGQSAPSATTETDLYTVPAGTSAALTSLFVANRGAAAGTFRVSISVGGGATANKDYLYYNVTIAANDTFLVDAGGKALAYLSATDKIRVYASSGDFSFNACGEEFT